MKNKYNSLFLFSTFILAFFSCTPSQDKDVVATAGDSAKTNSTNKTETISSAKYNLTISDIPFPFEILDNLYTKRIPFDQKVMNPISNISKYNQYNSKALNLGIYGADLAYAVTYEQFQLIGMYIKSTKKIAEELNIPLAFDQEMMDKYNKFKDNKDSLTKVVFDSYNKVDKALKNDERLGMAALVVTGSWLEGLYLSTKTFVNVPKSDMNAGLYKTIGDQKKSLVIVVKLLEEYKKDLFFASIINELNAITSEYTTKLNEQQLNAINLKVEKLRNRIIEGL